MRLLEFWSSHRAELARLAGEHVFLVAISTLAAIAIGLPLGIFAARRPRAGRPIVAIANVVQTIPSLALLGFLIPIPFVGLGARAALVALVLYALLPIVRTTAAGLTAVDAALKEAGTALGMTSRQLLRLVELPLALPSIVAGIRVAAVVGVGTATIAAAIGAGGLGEYIFRGLSMVDPIVILAGAIPAAALALGVDGALTAVERRLGPGGAARARLTGRRPIGLIALLLISAVAVAALSFQVARGSGRPVIRVGSKNFTEQLVLGEIVAGAIERWSNVAVERRLNLGGTFICDRAVRAGEIDVYVEYTGTALTAIFKESPDAEREPLRSRGSFDARCSTRPRPIRRRRRDARGAAGIRQHVCHSRAWRRRAAAWAARRLRMPCRTRGPGAPASATSFSSAPMATAGSPGSTGFASRRSRASWIWR